MAASIGKVTSVSISSGAMPRPSARIVTVGAVRSGNTSTGMLRRPRAGYRKDYSQPEHHPVMIDGPLNQSFHHLTSMDVAFSGQPCGR